MTKLSERLAFAVSLVPEGSVVMDVGSDSGKFVLFLEEKGHRCYAVENKEGPYKILTDNLSEHSSNVTPLFQDGLSFLPDDVDCVTILGMGGELIARITAEACGKLSNVSTMVVGPQSDFEMTFIVLNRLGYVNTGGAYVYEKHCYPILLFERGVSDCGADEMTYGEYPLKNKDPLLHGHLLNRRKNLLHYLDSGYENSKYRREVGKIDRLLNKYYGEETDK